MMMKHREKVFDSFLRLQFSQEFIFQTKVMRLNNGYRDYGFLGDNDWIFIISEQPKAKIAVRQLLPIAAKRELVITVVLWPSKTVDE